MRISQDVEAAELNQQVRLTDPGDSRPTAVCAQKLRVVRGEGKVIGGGRRGLLEEPLPAPLEEIPQVLVAAAAGAVQTRLAWADNC